MSRLIMTTLAAKPSTPSASKVALFPTSQSDLAVIDPNGIALVPIRMNQNTSDVTANATDTYLTGSSFTFPSGFTKAGTQFEWTFVMSKTAAGTATPVWSIRIGTGGIITDTARVQFTGVAQTAAADAGYASIVAVVRSVGASGVLQGGYMLAKNHATAASGLTNQANPNIVATVSAGFDMTVANSIIGVSCNPGASGVWTFQLVQAVCRNFTY